MYPERGFRPVEIGDVDVVVHDGSYHLFHLVLPNHDLIAHAVSEDGLSWRRAPHALFVGDPGAFDDDMLWTMHVFPERGGGFAMLYTGLSRAEEGRIQRIGLARSDDLIHWRKVEGGGFPVTLDHPAYEAGPEPRGWSSFRDPFLVETPDGPRILAAARAATGPPLRRGCVARLAWDGRSAPRALPPLHHPNRYDDVEVPSLFQRAGRWWLLGSTREDRKVHVWRGDTADGPFAAPSDNVLLPQGNYAARPALAPDGRTRLLWNFFVPPTGPRLLAPPKRVDVESDRLVVRSFAGFDARVRERREGASLGSFERVAGVAGARVEGPGPDGSTRLVAPWSTELFVLPDRWSDLRLRARVGREGSGKLGLLLRVDDDGEGYHVGLAPDEGLVAMRLWTARGTRVAPGASAFDYRELQQAVTPERREPLELELLACGGYLEVSIGGDVVLSLADDTVREGRVGLYVESGAVRVENLAIETLDGPRDGGYRLRRPA